jgi:hypothetical protein
MIAVNAFNSNTVLFAKAVWSIPKLQPGHLYGEPNCWLETACYLGVTLDTYVFVASYRSSEK